MVTHMQILYEDENIVAVNKPAGLITHSDGRTKEETAEEWFNEKYGGLASPKRSEARLRSDELRRSEGGYVHRLDRDTSGVLVFAKNKAAHEFLRKAFHDREVQKTYVAIVYGALQTARGVIDFDIGRSRSDFRLRSAQPKAKGRLRDALTRYEVLARTQEYSLLKVMPETGRTHQIRVHLKAIHHPVVGDRLYAPGFSKKEAALGLARLALHAYEVDLPLPGGGRQRIQAPLPADFKDAAGKIAPQTTF